MFARGGGGGVIRGIFGVILVCKFNSNFSRESGSQTPAPLHSLLDLHILNYWHCSWKNRASQYTGLVKSELALKGVDLVLQHIIRNILGMVTPPRVTCV